MNKYLSLMHDTAGKTNRIKKRVDEFMELLNEKYPKVLTDELEVNKDLDGSFFLVDIRNMAESLDKELDAFYVKNKDQKRISVLLESRTESLETFTSNILASVDETDDMDRKTALLIYATAIKSFIGDGNWRRHIVMSVRWLKAVRKKESREFNDTLKMLHESTHDVEIRKALLLVQNYKTKYLNEEDPTSD